MNSLFFMPLSATLHSLNISRSIFRYDRRAARCQWHESELLIFHHLLQGAAPEAVPVKCLQPDSKVLCWESFNCITRQSWHTLIPSGRWAFLSIVSIKSAVLNLCHLSLMWLNAANNEWCRQGVTGQLESFSIMIVCIITRAVKLTR